MYTLTEMNTGRCNSVSLVTGTNYTLGHVSLNVKATITHTPKDYLISELLLTLTPEQWQEVVYKINDALKEIGYENKIGV